MTSTTITRTFQGQTYAITLKYSSEKIEISLEQDLECGTWKNAFTSAYIEDLTQKTGFKRKFGEFYKILDLAIQGSNINAQNLDILTYQDLENMKAKKSGLDPPKPNQLNPLNVKANKRYIIVSATISGSSDKVHYPLTLNYEEINNVDKLRETVKKLKMELNDVRSSRDSLSGIHSQSQKGESFFITENAEKKLMSSTNTSIQSHASEPLLQENELLKTKIRRLEESFSQKKGALEVDSIVKQKIDLEVELDSVKMHTSRQLTTLQKNLEDRDTELERKRQEILDLKKELTQSLCVNGDEGSQRLRQNLVRLSEETEKELTFSRKQVQNLQRDMDKNLTDIDFFKRNDQKQKNRIRQLEIELETVTKRVSGKGVSDRLYSPYNKGSSSSGAAGRRANSVPVKSYSPANRYNNAGKVSTVAQKPLYQRTGSNDAGNKSRLSPSYNYGYKKNQPATQSANIRTGAQGSNTSQNRLYGNNNNSRNNSNSSPGNRFGYQSGNNARTGANNARVSPNNSNTRVSPGLNNSRTSPGSRLTQGIGNNRNSATNSNTRVSPANRVTAGTNNNRVSPGNSRVSPGNSRVQPGMNARNNTIQSNSGSNSRLSPAAKNYMQPTNSTRTNNHNQRAPGNTYGVGGAKNASPGNRYSNQSPGTRYNNYMNQNKKPSQGPINNNKVPNEFNDRHLKAQQNTAKQPVSTQNKDLDNRLDKLSSLLSKAKK